MTTAKPFQNGRGQADRLPRDLSTGEWFVLLDRYQNPFMPEGRDQPMPQTRDMSDWC